MPVISPERGGQWDSMAAGFPTKFAWLNSMKGCNGTAMGMLCLNSAQSVFDTIRRRGFSVAFFAFSSASCGRASLCMQCESTTLRVRSRHVQHSLKIYFFMFFFTGEVCSFHFLVLMFAVAAGAGMLWLGQGWP